MAKDKLTDYSSTAGSNTEIGGVNIDEGMLPSNVNNAIREQMSHLADFAAGTSGLDVLKLQDDTDTNSIKIQAPASVTTTTTFTLPDGDGSANQSLVTNGSGALSFSTRLANVVEDTTPQLGGNLDTNGNDITGTGNLNLTGTVTADGLTISTSDPFITLTDSDTGVDHEIDGQSGIGNLAINVDKNSEGSNSGFIVNVKGNQYMRVDDGGDISFYDSTGVTQGLFWDASTQRLGLGTSSPSARLEVHGASGGIAAELQPNANDDIVLNIRNATANQVGYIQAHSDSISIDGDFTKFTTSGTERMRIDNNGTLLRGLTSRVIGGATYRGIAVEESTRILGLNQTGGGTATMIGFHVSGTQVGGITSSASATSYSTTSDYRLKENVVADWDATTRLKQLNPVRFNFIADADTTVDGFLAHEVQDIVPEAISGTHNEVDDEGNPVYQGIDQSKLVPLLVKTIQELEARIAALENA